VALYYILHNPKPIPLLSWWLFRYAVWLYSRVLSQSSIFPSYVLSFSRVSEKKPFHISFSSGFARSPSGSCHACSNESSTNYFYLGNSDTFRTQKKKNMAAVRILRRHVPVTFVLCCCLLGALAKFRKELRHVCLSHWAYFHDFWYLSICLRSFEKIKD
jgi:hypothetical protein